jgi:stress-induced morphogen
MDNTEIYFKSAKGIMHDADDLHYDAVRLLRLVDGIASVGELRPKFPDLSDDRFLKAMVTLIRGGLVRPLRTAARIQADHSSKPHIDAHVRDITQKVLETLDFTTLDRKMLDAMRTGSAQNAAAAPTAATGQPRAIQPAEPARVRHEPAAMVQLAPGTPEAETYAQLVAALRPHVEAELRASLRPEIEDELRRQLVVTLRPALEAEIREKLTAALKPRVELELRMKNRSTDKSGASDRVHLDAQVVSTKPAGMDQFNRAQIAA